MVKYTRYGVYFYRAYVRDLEDLLLPVVKVGAGDLTKRLRGARRFALSKHPVFGRRFEAVDDNPTLVAKCLSRHKAMQFEAKIHGFLHEAGIYPMGYGEHKFLTIVTKEWFFLSETLIGAFGWWLEVEGFSIEEPTTTMEVVDGKGRDLYKWLPEQEEV